jgi:ribosome-binding factor A
MPASRRTDQLGQFIRDELSDIMRRSMSDPRLHGVVSITRVVLTPDLRHAKVHISALGGAAEREQAVTALTGAAGFLRRELAGRLRVRYIPDLSFLPDDSLEHGTHIRSLLRQVEAELQPAEAEQVRPADQPGDDQH